MSSRTVTLVINENGEVTVEGTRVGYRSATRGYQQVYLKLHHLVALAFYGLPPDDLVNPVVHHKDSNPRNNRADNLEWLSQAENARRRYGGRSRVLTEEDVRNIRLMKPAATIRLKDLAVAFGVTWSAISAVRAGRTFSGKTPSNRAILTAEQVQAIRGWKAPKPTAASVARMYKVSKRTILNIWHGKY